MFFPHKIECDQAYDIQPSWGNNWMELKYLRMLWK
jgi:hypothetical protein